MGFLRRIFGRGVSEDNEEASPGPALSEEQLRVIGTDEDLMRDYDAQAERNMQAAEAEQRGDVKAAIALYEQNVGEEFVGAYPYERLASIYGMRSPQDALRVTDAFIALSRSGRLPKGSQRSADRRLPEFEARRKKLLGQSR